MKKLKLSSLLLLGALLVSACNGGNNNVSSSSSSSFDSSVESTVSSAISTSEEASSSESSAYFMRSIKMPSLNQVEDYPTVREVIPNVPDLLIFEIVADTIAKADEINQFEYIKVYNNTNEPYNLKGHRIILANPTSTLNNQEANLNGERILEDGYIFHSMFYEDTFIAPLDYALVWILPYYWDRGGYTDILVYPETMEKTNEDFKSYWKINTDINIIKACNQPVGGGAVAPSKIHGTPVVYATTHINSKLLRTFEIQKFNDEAGVTYQMANKYEEVISGSQSPIYVGGRFAFNTLNIVDSSQTVINEIENRGTYFTPIVRATFLGRVNTTTLDRVTKTADFSSTSNPGVGGWEAGSGIQFALPEEGTIKMKIVPLYGERNYYLNNLVSTHHKYVVIADEIVDFKDIDTEVPLEEAPSEFNPEPAEVYNDNRLFSAAPHSIKIFNLARTYTE